MKNIAFLLLLSYSFILPAQVKVSGRVPYVSNAVILAKKTDDYISGRQITIGKDSLNNEGEFSLSFNSTKPDYIQLSVAGYSSGFYALPDSEYIIELLPKDSVDVFTLGRDLPVGLKILAPVYDSVNHGILQVNAVLDSFFNKNYELFVRKAAKPAVDKFKPVIIKRFSRHPFLVRNYLRFSLAPIDESVFRSRADLFKEYFSGPVMYWNKDYMDYFNQFFIKHFQQLAMGKHEAEFNRALNINRSFNELVTLVQRADTLLKNDTIARLLVLKGLQEQYYQPRSNMLAIQVVLFTAAGMKQQPFSSTASNILQSLTGLQQGAPAPAFTATDINGKTIDLSSFKGKYVYLFFWAKWCDQCLQEMKFLSSLSERYKRKIQVVAVNIDNDAKGLLDYVNRRKFSWVNIHDASKAISESYRIKAIPAFFLIDPDGDILQSPALLPSENIRGVFEDIMRKK